MKRWMCLLLAVLLLLSLTACHKKPEATGENATGKQENETTQTAENTQATQNTEATENKVAQTIHPSDLGDAGTRMTKMAEKTTFAPITLPDSQGPIVISKPKWTGIKYMATYNEVYRFVDGEAVVKVKLKAGDRYVSINKEGKVVNVTAKAPKESAPTPYPSAIGATYSAGEGMYAYTDYVTAEGNELLYGIMDKNGKKVTDVKYWGRLAITFYDGYALVGKPDGTWVMVDTQGNEYGSHLGGRSNGYGTAVCASRDALGNTQAHLYNRDGKCISAGYDSIGYFYEGLALVQKNGKVGIIDYLGRERLAPTIDIDTVSYNGNQNSQFSTVFLEDDAFILPIGGELAVITIDRQSGREQLEEATRAYEDFLAGKICVYVRDAAWYVWGFADVGDRISAYAYADVSADGIPELFLKGQQHTMILSYTNQGLAIWYTSTTSGTLSVLENGAVLEARNNKDDLYFYITFDSLGNKSNITFSNPQNSTVYRFNGSTISKEKWAELTKPYLSLKEAKLDWKPWVWPVQ